MKNISLILLLMILATACGKGGSGGGGVTGKTISALLNDEESKLVTKLIEEKQIEEKELFKRLMKLSSFDNKVVEKLEAHINVECSHGLCQITENNLTPMSQAEAQE